MAQPIAYENAKTVSFGSGAWFYSRVAGLTNGSYMVGYARQSGGIALWNDLVGSGYSLSASVPFQPNQIEIAALSDSNFVVAWHDMANGGEVRGQYFQQSSSALGLTFSFDGGLAGDQTSVSVNMAINPFGNPGTLEAVWRNAADNQLYAAQIFPDHKVFPLVISNTVGADNPASAPFSDGTGELVYRIGGDLFVRSYQFVNGFGAPSAPIDSTTVSSQYDPRIATLSDDRFVVAYTDDQDVYLRIFNKAGTALTGNINVASNPALTQQGSIGLIVLPDDRIVVAFTETEANNIQNVKLRVLNPDGTPDGADFFVNGPSNFHRFAPDLALLADGRFVVTWSDDGGEANNGAWEIFTRVFDPRPGPVALIGTNINDYLTGTPFDDTIYGGLGNDTLDGGPGRDSMFGGPGNDWFSDGPGADLMDGGTGTDYAEFPGLRSAYTLTNFGGGNVLVSGPDAVDIVNAVERLKFGLVTVTTTLLDPLGFRLAGFGPGAGGWTDQDRYPRDVADVNGDGFGDIVGFGDAGVFIALGSASGFGPIGHRLAAFGLNNGGWASQDKYPRHLADVNGDGLADIIGFGDAGAFVSLATGGGSFGPTVHRLAAFGTNTGWFSDDRYHRELADVNGDGLADIVGFGDSGVFVSLATGGGTFGPVEHRLAAFGTVNGGWNSQTTYPRHLADVNGDGKADIVGFADAGVYVALATGGGNFGPVTFGLAAFGRNAGWSNNDLYPREVADVNGDGMADIVGFGDTGTWVAISNGDGSFRPITFELQAFGQNAGWFSDNVYPRLLADINNDDLADIVGFGQAGVYASLASGFHLI